MSRTRLYLMLFGIVSVMLMSSVMIRRILLQNQQILDISEKSRKLIRVDRTLGEVVSDIHESVARSDFYFSEPDDSLNKKVLSTLVLEDYRSLRKDLRNYQLDIDSAQNLALIQALEKTDEIIAVQRDRVIPLFTYHSRSDTLWISAQDAVRQLNPVLFKATAQLEAVRGDIGYNESANNVGQLQRMLVGTIILIVLAVLMFLAGLIGLIILLGSPAWKNRSAT